MEANPNTPTIYSTLTDLSDAFFPDNPRTPVQAELWKWFLFALSEKGITIKDLPEVDFPEFTEQLKQLVIAARNWAHQQPIGQEGGHHL